jgi:hypothetical protein
MENGFGAMEPFIIAHPGYFRFLQRRAFEGRK